MTDWSAIPSPFYRVAVKGLIFDDSQRLLMCQTKHGKWEVPGGGWEFDETIEAAFTREIQEELGVVATLHGPIQFVYRSQSVQGSHVLRLVFRATIESTAFTPGDVAGARFVTAAELRSLTLVAADRAFVEHISAIWPEKVEK